MLIYQKNNKLNISFQTGSNPPDNPDISTYKTDGTVHAFVGDTDLGVAATLSSIAVTTPPTTISYTAGDTLDLTGMVVTATYSDTSTAIVTGYTTTPASGATLATSNTSITVSYTDGTVTKTTTTPITVSAA